MDKLPEIFPNKNGVELIFEVEDDGLTINIPNTEQTIEVSGMANIILSYEDCFILAMNLLKLKVLKKIII
jgi:hypothetical protein